MSSRLCPFCMRAVESDICPHCSRSTDYAGVPMHLPAGYVVRGSHPYVIGAALGQGGFGITYIALDMVTNERVAIKEFFPTFCAGRSEGSFVIPYQHQEETYEKGRERFLDEARVLKSLSDLNSIVNVLDFFEFNNSAYLVMEFLDGGSLKEHMKKNGKFSAQTFLTQIQPLMEDIHRMHQRGVIHRDIAPDNIILLPDGQMKLIDFGAARSFVGDRSMTVVVKKGFAPLEQYLTKGCTASTDVYAMAATIYYCITGTVPKDSAERQNDNLPFVSASSLGADLTSAQEKALKKALELQQKDRIQSMQELLNRITVKESPQTHKPPVPKPEKKKKPAKTTKNEKAEKKTASAPRKKFSGVLAAVAALLIAGCSFFFPRNNFSSVPSSAPSTPPSAPPSSVEAETTPAAVPDSQLPITFTDEESRALAEAEIRYALSLLLDRNYLCNAVISNQLPASTYIPMGTVDFDGSQFHLNSGTSPDFTGYYDVSPDAYENNFNTAYQILRKYYEVDEMGMFVNFPELTYLYNTSTTHENVGEYVQSVLQSVGITLNLKNMDWNTFLSARKNGEFAIARNGWIGDYNDPLSFLDMWTTTSGNNDSQFGRDDHSTLAIYSLNLTDLGYDINITNGTWSETYDVLVDLIATCADSETRFAMMHRAEDLLMSTGAITPLYYYADQYALKKNVDGFYATPTGLKFFTKTTFNGSDKSLSVSLGSAPDTLDPAATSSMSDLSIISHLFSGLAKWDVDPQGNPVIVADCAESLTDGVVNSDGTITYTYTLKNGLKWSNGANVTAKDFVFAWRRAASVDFGADYGYLFECVKGYPNNLAVEAVSDRQLRVTLNRYTAHWNELLAFPLYFPVHEAAISSNWASKASTFVSNGAYVLKKWEHGNLIVAEKNPDYHSKSDVIMNQLNFHLTDDIETMTSNYLKGNWQFCDEAITGSGLNTSESHTVSALGTYFVCWNINFPLLPR